MNLQQTVSVILEKSVTVEFARRFADEQFGLLNAYLKEKGYFDTNFPNGFADWHETHYEIVVIINYLVENDWKGLANTRHEEQGSGGLYELAAELTTEFETQYKGAPWGGELDYHDTLKQFLKQKGL